MAVKILLLCAAAMAVWLLSRPRGGVRRNQETAMTQCAKCGVYHSEGEPCGCEDK